MKLCWVLRPNCSATRRTCSKVPQAQLPLALHPAHLFARTFSTSRHVLSFLLPCFAELFRVSVFFCLCFLASPLHRHARQCRSFAESRRIVEETLRKVRPGHAWRERTVEREQGVWLVGETVCPQCRGELRRLGEDVAGRLEYVPATLCGDSVRTDVVTHSVFLRLALLWMDTNLRCVV